MITTIAGQYTTSYNTIEEFNLYFSALALTIPDPMVEHYLVSATTLLNSFQWLGVAPKRSIIARELVTISNSIVSIANYTATQELKDKRILFRFSTGDITGTILEVLPDNTLITELDTEVGAITESIEVVIAEPVMQSFYKYFQRCSFPRKMHPFQDLIIPTPIKIATNEIALFMSTTDITQMLSTGDDIKSAKVDVLEVEYFNKKRQSLLEMLPQMVATMLEPYLLKASLVSSRNYL